MSARTVFQTHIDSLRVSFTPVFDELTREMDKAFNNSLSLKLGEGVSRAVEAANTTAYKWGDKVSTLQ